MTLPEFISINDGYPDVRNRRKISQPRQKGMDTLIHRLHSLEKDLTRLSTQEAAFNAHLRTSSGAFHEIMVEKKELSSNLDRIRRASSCLLEASSIIRACTDPLKLPQDLCNILVQWGYPFATVFQIEGTGLITRALAGAGYCDVHIPMSETCLDEIKIINKSCVTLSSVAGQSIHRPIPTFTDPDLCELPLSVLVIPLCPKNRVRAVIMVYEQSGTTFVEEDIALLSEIGLMFPQTLLDFIL